MNMPAGLHRKSSGLASLIVVGGTLRMDGFIMDV
jgi:hypothetical protein